MNEKFQTLSLDKMVKPIHGAKKASSKVKKMDPVSSLYLSSKQTLTHSIKTRAIVKNNFGMPQINNSRFLPVNRVEAKGTIFRSVLHDTEIDETMLKRDSLLKKSAFKGNNN